MKRYIILKLDFQRCGSSKKYMKKFMRICACGYQFILKKKNKKHSKLKKLTAALLLWWRRIDVSRVVILGRVKDYGARMMRMMVIVLHDPGGGSGLQRLFSLFLLLDIAGGLE